jgi:hypothetical protein
MFEDIERLERDLTEERLRGLRIEDENESLQNINSNLKKEIQQLRDSLHTSRTLQRTTRTNLNELQTKLDNRTECLRQVVHQLDDERDTSRALSESIRSHVDARDEALLNLELAREVIQEVVGECVIGRYDRWSMPEAVAHVRRFAKYLGCRVTLSTLDYIVGELRGSQKWAAATAIEHALNTLNKSNESLAELHGTVTLLVERRYMIESGEFKSTGFAAFENRLLSGNIQTNFDLRPGDSIAVDGCTLSEETEWSMTLAELGEKVMRVSNGTVVSLNLT